MNHDLRLGLFLSHFPVFGPVMPWPGERSGLTPDVHFRLHRAEQFRTSSLVRAGNYIPSCSFIKKQSNNYRAPTLPLPLPLPRFINLHDRLQSRWHYSTS